ncbi:TolC family protein [uncultured Neptuniibacter sp.]|uniref:TolC family protein n=1 Tax=uncultured Neptuniibacter sp. TaxID=502143 RepID=UPI002609C66B|nr:TolC family protein [uncultured Neptuniibacter sp.]
MRYSTIFFMTMAAVSSSYLHAGLSLTDAVDEAIQNDNWNRSNHYQEQATRAEALASGQLPDPKLRLALANLPLDSFDLQQENMTQLQFGVSQQFPRGDSLSLREQRFNRMADQNRFQRWERRARLKRDISLAWLALHQTEEQLQKLQQKSHLFTELVTISRANFRSGTIRRYELIDAELQLTRLQERIVLLQQQRAQQRAQLSQWVDPKQLAEALPLTFTLPVIQRSQTTQSEREKAILLHPQVKILQQEIEVRQKGIELAEQAYKPGFKLDANYGYRGDHPKGQERSDFFSVALTMDLPLFTEKRQDARRNAAIQKREAGREMRLLKIRELQSGMQAALATKKGVEQRLSIYNQRYLQQLSAKRQSAMHAYAANDARFTDVASAAISELENQLQRIVLVHEQAKAQLQINYFLAGIDPALTTDQVQSAKEVRP